MPALLGGLGGLVGALGVGRALERDEELAVGALEAAVALGRTVHQLRLELSLRVGWLIRVWRPGRAVVADMVLLDLAGPDDGSGPTEVLALQWESDPKAGPKPRCYRWRLW